MYGQQSNGAQGFGLNFFNQGQQPTQQNPFQNTQGNSLSSTFGNAFSTSTTNQFLGNKLNTGQGNVFGQPQNQFTTSSSNFLSTPQVGGFNSSMNKLSTGPGQSSFGGFGTSFGQTYTGTTQQSNSFGTLGSQTTSMGTGMFNQQQNNLFSGPMVNNQGSMGTTMGFGNAVGQISNQNGNTCIYNTASNTNADVVCIQIIDKTDFVYGLIDGTVAIGSTTAPQAPIQQFKLSSPILSLAVNNNKEIFTGTMNGLYVIQQGSQPVQIGTYSGPVFQIATIGKYIFHSEMVLTQAGPKRTIQQSKNSWSAHVNTGNQENLPIAYTIKVGMYDGTYKPELDVAEAACSGHFFLVSTGATTGGSLSCVLMVPNINNERPFIVYNIKQGGVGISSRMSIAEDTSISVKLSTIAGNKRLSSGVIGCGYDRVGLKAMVVTNDRCMLVYDLNNKLVNQKQLQFPILHACYSDHHRTFLFTAGTEIAYYQTVGNNTGEWGKIPGTSFGEICSFSIDDQKLAIAVGSASALYQGTPSQGASGQVRVSIALVNLPSVRQGVYPNTYHLISNKTPTNVI
ncbi:hypothetical protein GL50803_006139 [Giardia duodenalis]|uniref:Uncharacterized protein n=1 Tax=Giardia intestinalis (strain ATCC 50803 / WB clone C6) TaxID=184922 RepID=A8BRG1_GIAIC|nr:hypothetical protein GL50803_006139 [Giardia intestinalis]KAE8306011.1 hypothetical protein GL50803_006139 [Giardia intestinalis]|eukprot:XP_001705257.1 Hypothetical protein GL50803_6139 [Giardia lamblia ATCC 50803]